MGQSIPSTLNRSSEQVEIITCGSPPSTWDFCLGELPGDTGICNLRDCTARSLLCPSHSTNKELNTGLWFAEGHRANKK